jgi:hypothetical protein
LLQSVGLLVKNEEGVVGGGGVVSTRSEKADLVPAAVRAQVHVVAELLTQQGTAV